jgi:hypothetical protein
MAKKYEATILVIDAIPLILRFAIAQNFKLKIMKKENFFPHSAGAIAKCCIFEA